MTFLRCGEVRSGPRSGGRVRACLLAAAIASACALGGARDATAQSSKASAEALFAEGRRLMGEGQIAEACPKFADSQKLDPSSGTLLNLGNCYEKLGRNASAWASYQEAASLASSTGRQDNLQAAQRRATALEPTLARVSVTVADPIEGLEVKCDGAPVTKAEWGLAVPVDSGPHTYIATAPRHKPAKVEITVDKTPDGGPAPKLSVVIPALAELPPEPVVVAPRSGATGPGADQGGWRPQRTVAIVVAGVGVASAAAGAILLGAAVSDYNSSLKQCPTDPNRCTQTGVNQRDDARTKGTLATVTFVAGGVLAAGGVVLWLTAPSARSSRGGLSVSPTVGGLQASTSW